MPVIDWLLHGRFRFTCPCTFSLCAGHWFWQLHNDLMSLHIRCVLTPLSYHKCIGHNRLNSGWQIKHEIKFLSHLFYTSLLYRTYSTIIQHITLYDRPTFLVTSIFWMLVNQARPAQYQLVQAGLFSKRDITLSKSSLVKLPCSEQQEHMYAVHGRHLSVQLQLLLTFQFTDFTRYLRQLTKVSGNSPKAKLTLTFQELYLMTLSTFKESILQRV